jgi:signal peptidase II
MKPISNITFKINGLYLRLGAYLLIILGIVLLDQGTKWYCEKYYLVNHSHYNIKSYTNVKTQILEVGTPPLLKGFQVSSDSSHSWLTLSLNYVRNTGAAWGIFGNMKEEIRPFFFNILTILSIFIIIFVFFKQPSQTLGANFAFSLILGGALGNLIDRFYLHYVVDWIDVEWQIGSWHYAYPVFNIADSAISIGAVILLLSSFFFKPQKPLTS